MIHGGVNARREAIVRLRVRGLGGAEQDVDAVVDSGFTASLTLPATVVAALGLVRLSSSGAVLADGSIRQFNVYAAEVAWDSGWRPVLVSAVGDEVLLGMRLLEGHQLRIAVVPGGVVEITPRSAERPGPAIDINSGLRYFSSQFLNFPDRPGFRGAGRGETVSPC